MKRVFHQLRKRGIQAVLFDKDGTLLDFNKTWKPLMDSFRESISREFQLSLSVQTAILERLGVDGDGFTPDSVFVKDHFDAVLEAVCGTEGLTPEQSRGLEQMIRNSVNTLDDFVRPHLIDSSRDVLSALKDEGFLLGLATSDFEEAARDHVKQIRLESLLDFVAGDNGTRAVKPHSEILDEFCMQFQMAPQQTAMVGDSIIDMLFAKNNDMGCAVYVRSGFPDPEAEALADLVLESVADLNIGAEGAAGLLRMLAVLGQGAQSGIWSSFFLLVIKRSFLNKLVFIEFYLIMQ